MANMWAQRVVAEDICLSVCRSPCVCCVVGGPFAFPQQRRALEMRTREQRIAAGARVFTVLCRCSDSEGAQEEFEAAESNKGRTRDTTCGAAFSRFFPANLLRLYYTVMLIIYYNICIYV